jgi:hypothetical protein
MWVARIENYLTVWTSLEIIHFLYRDADWKKNIGKEVFKINQLKWSNS